MALFSVVAWLLVISVHGGESGNSIPKEESGWKAAGPGYEWSFPRDHWGNGDFKTEWWYFVGHLESGEGRRFGYQVTFFRVGVVPGRPALDSSWAASDLVMVHLAVTDLEKGVHRFEEVLYRAAPLLGGFPEYPDGVIAWSRGAAGSAEKWVLGWDGEGFELRAGDEAQGLSLQLSARSLREVVLHGPGGVSRKGGGASAASLYYSLTRLETEGVLTVDGVPYQVRGSSWLDRERGTDQLDEEQVGWDWFGLQLEDGHDLMLFRLRDEKGETDFSGATLVTEEGDVSFLEPGEWSLRSLDTWASDESGATYPSRWRLEVPGRGMQFTVVPQVADQENRGRIFYWEGSVVVQDADGRPVGLGYAELTGYGTGNRPAL